MNGGSGVSMQINITGTGSGGFVKNINVVLPSMGVEFLTNLPSVDLIANVTYSSEDTCTVKWLGKSGGLLTTTFIEHENGAVEITHEFSVELHRTGEHPVSGTVVECCKAYDMPTQITKSLIQLIIDADKSKERYNVCS